MRQFVLSIHFVLIGLLGFIGWGMPDLKAQDTLSELPSWRIRHEVGFSAGTTTGLGPTYRLWLNRYGIQINAHTALKENREFYKFGYCFFFSLLRTPVNNFFLYQGNNIRFISEYQMRSNWPISWDPMPYTNYTQKGDASLGLGYELFQGPGKLNPIGLSIMTGLGAYDNLKTISYSAEIAVLYKFNKDIYFRTGGARLHE